MLNDSVAYMFNLKTKRFNYYDQDLAVSEVVGTILLLGIVSVALVIIVLIGYNVINNVQSESKINAMEQAFTVADTKISKARFSTSIFQEIPLVLRDGTLNVNDSWDDSHILIYDFNNTTKKTNIIYNSTLGTIRSVFDQGEVGYQDGGVWRLDNKNGSIMISPPDFDYNGVTLTLPIMIFKGIDSLAASGNREVAICVNSTDSRMIYPNSTFGNPIPSDHFLNITIKSRYYRAWADYINTRTRAHVIIDPINQTANVSLRAGSPLQTGPAWSGFNTIGLDTSYDTPIDQFNIHLVPPNKGNDYRGSFFTEVPSGQELRIYVDRTKAGDGKYYATICIVYYDPLNVTTEIWYSKFSHFRMDKDPIDLNMLDHSEILTYVQPSDVDNFDDEVKKSYPDSSINSASWGLNMSSPWNPWYTPGSWDVDPLKSDYDYPFTDVTFGSQKSLYDLTQHYLWLMSYLAEQQGISPVYTTNHDNKPQWKYDSSSWINISYKSSVDIKYLYLTECTLNTSLGIR